MRATPRELLVHLNTEVNRIMEDPKFADFNVKRLGLRNACPLPLLRLHIYVLRQTPPGFARRKDAFGQGLG